MSNPFDETTPVKTQEVAPVSGAANNPWDTLDVDKSVLQEPDSGTSTVSDTGTDDSEGSSILDNPAVAAAASKVEQGLDSAKAKADEFTAQFGEERLWNALVEYATGEATEAAIWLAENAGKEIIDLLVLYATWSPRLSKYIPHKGARAVLAATSLFALVGGSAIESVLNKLSEKGYLTEETSKWLNENGVEPLESLNLRSILIGAFTGSSGLNEEKEQKLQDYYGSPERGIFQRGIGKLYGYETDKASGWNSGGQVMSQRDLMKQKFYNCGGRVARKGIYKH